MLVIIPTNRSVNLEYLSPLIDHGARFVVVDDSDGSVRIDHPQFEVYNWNDQEHILGKFARAIPRRNGACRDFGFYIAWKETDADELILALDDDCRVEDARFISDLDDLFSNGCAVESHGAGRHFNIIDMYLDVEPDVFPRGFPYSSRVEYQRWNTARTENRIPVFNLGLWKGVFDVNAIDKLNGATYDYPDARLEQPSCIVGRDVFISACSMNMHFRREVIPALYQLPMHVPVMPNWNIDRYGDIWAGFILKTMMDRRGDTMTVGGPMIVHNKRGDFHRNICQEHACHLVNDEFLLLLEKFSEHLESASYLEMMAQLNEFFRISIKNCSPILGRYIRHLIETTESWIAALEQA